MSGYYLRSSGGPSTSLGTYVTLSLSVSENSLRTVRGRLGGTCSIRVSWVMLGTISDGVEPHMELVSDRTRPTGKNIYIYIYIFISCDV